MILLLRISRYFITISFSSSNSSEVAVVIVVVVVIVTATATVVAVASVVSASSSWIEVSTVITATSYTSAVRIAEIRPCLITVEILPTSCGTFTSTSWYPLLMLKEASLVLALVLPTRTVGSNVPKPVQRRQ